MNKSELFKNTLNRAVDLMNMCEGLEIRSALKECASNSGIEYGSDMNEFVLWSENEMGL